MSLPHQYETRGGRRCGGGAAGKKLANGRMSVAECYVVGVDPEKADEDFRIVSFQMNADGTQDLASIVFEPARDKWNVPAACPVVKGSVELGGEWQAVTDGIGAEMRLFRVEVELL